MLPDAWLCKLAPEVEWEWCPVHSMDGHSKAGRARSRGSQSVLKALPAFRPWKTETEMLRTLTPLTDLHISHLSHAD